MTPKQVRLHDIDMIVREAGAEDFALIFATWMESARQLRQCRRSIFNSFYPQYVRNMMANESAVVLTLADGKAIQGWACGRPSNVLHFAYVPSSLRGSGLGRAVIEAVLGMYPQTIYVDSSPISMPHHKRFQYNPFIRDYLP